MLVARAPEVIGAVALSDVMKPEAVETVAALHELGLERRYSRATPPAATERVAEPLGIPQGCAGALPTRKVAVLEQLQADGHRVAMVGGGINRRPCPRGRRAPRPGRSQP